MGQRCVDGDEFVAFFVGGGVEGDGQRGLALFVGVAADGGHETHGGDGDFACAQVEAVGGR